MLSTSTGIRPNLGMLGMVHCSIQEGKGTVRIKSEEPILFLLIGHDIDQGDRPLGVVNIL